VARKVSLLPREAKEGPGGGGIFVPNPSSPCPRPLRGTESNGSYAVNTAAVEVGGLLP
jgi:hypothetical protein